MTGLGFLDSRIDMNLSKRIDRHFAPHNVVPTSLSRQHTVKIRNWRPAALLAHWRTGKEEIHPTHTVGPVFPGSLFGRGRATPMDRNIALQPILCFRAFLNNCKPVQFVGKKSPRFAIEYHLNFR